MVEQGEIEHFEIEARLDVTLKVNDSDFYKPGASGKIRFKGLPDEDQIKAAYEYLLFSVIDPQLEGALEKVNERLLEQRRREHGTT